MATPKPEPQLEMLDAPREFFDVRFPDGRKRRESIVKRIEILGSNEFALHFSGDEWRVSHIALGCLVASGRTNAEAVRNANSRADKAVQKHGTMACWIERTAEMVRELETKLATTEL